MSQQKICFWPSTPHPHPTSRGNVPRPPRTTCDSDLGFLTWSHLIYPYHTLALLDLSEFLLVCFNSDILGRSILWYPCDNHMTSIWCPYDIHHTHIRSMWSDMISIWVACTMRLCHHDNTAPWHHSSMVPWIHGTMTPRPPVPTWAVTSSWLTFFFLVTYIPGEKRKSHKH